MRLIKCRWILVLATKYFRHLQLGEMIVDILFNNVIYWTPLRYLNDSIRKLDALPGDRRLHRGRITLRLGRCFAGARHWGHGSYAGGLQFRAWSIHYTSITLLLSFQICENQWIGVIWDEINSMKHILFDSEVHRDEKKWKNWGSCVHIFYSILLSHFLTCYWELMPLSSKIMWDYIRMLTSAFFLVPFFFGPAPGVLSLLLFFRGFFTASFSGSGGMTT